MSLTASTKHVLFVSPVGELGGGEQVLLALMERLPAHGLQASLACMRPGPLTERAAALGCATYAFRDHRYRDLLAVRAGTAFLKGAIGKCRADLVHCNHAAHIYAGPASRAARVPEIWHLYDYPYNPDFTDWINRRIPASHVVFMTERVQSGYSDLQRRGPHSIVPAYCVDVPGLRATPTMLASDIRVKYGIPTEGPLLLTVARLQEHKGHRVLLDAAAKVCAEYPTVQFAIVGKASGAEQEAYRDSLLATAERLGIAGSVHFTGFVPDSDLPSLYRAATALVHPAITEGFGLVLIEAMAVGTPVVATRADGPPTIITDNANGLLVPVSDSDALAGAISRLLGDAELRDRLGRAGYDSATGYDVETMVQKTVSVYHQLLSPGKEGNA